MLRVLKGFTIYVLTPDDLCEKDYTVIKDEWEDINKVITKARTAIKDDVLILPCDLPFVEREDIDVLLEGKIRIAPSQNGGTSALFLPATLDIITQFGENSFETHTHLLACNLLKYMVYESDNFRDIDSEEDIAWALEHRKESEFSQFMKILKK